MYTLGIDIGASKVAAALVKDGRILCNTKISYKRKTTAAVNAAIFEAADAAAANSKIIGIGLGVPCALGKNGRVLACANIPVLNPQRIAGTLGMTYRVRVFIENDVKAAVLAELKYGIGRKSKNFVFLAFGTGIGGAIVVDGKLYNGGLGWAGEFGHMKMQSANGKAQSDWEKLASAQFLRAGGRQNELAKNIAIGLLNITYALAPEFIVIGGGLLSLWNKEFQRNVVLTMKKMRLSPSLPLPKIIRSRFGENAGVIGAALLPALPRGNK